ncbi:hypothetical protein V8G54_017384 [Vigna mungo]|uniref:Pentatricopeptide repeat-containing protein n=1 Tax=Vigna mungo TaxID=3915 RepID=A0AAQ3NM10_VIGMU
MLLLSPHAEQTQALLERCSNIKELMQIHGQLLKKGTIRNHLTVHRLLASYARIELGDLAYTRMIFDRISLPNTVIWNEMIRAYSNSNAPEAALLLYHQMLHHSVPHNSYTFPFLLKACSALSAFEEIMQIHAHIIKMGFGSEVYAANSLLRVYAISGNIHFAHVLFNQLPSPDIVSWNTMIDGAGMHKEALSLLPQMLAAGIKPDSITLSCSLSACAGLDMYVKCGEMEKALLVFSKLDKKCVCAWTAIIGGFAIHGKGREALDWFTQMQLEGTKPNSPCRTH